VNKNYISKGSAVSKMLNDTTEFLNNAHSKLRAILPNGRALIDYALNYIETARTAIDASVIGSACSLMGYIASSFGGFLSLPGIIGDVGIQRILGVCSQRIRAYSFGPVYQTTSDTGTVLKNLGISTVNSLIELTGFGDNLDSITINSKITAEQSANQLSLVNFVRNIAIINATKVAVRPKYESYDEATDIMNIVITALDAQLLKLGDEAPHIVYSAYDIVLTNHDAYTALELVRPLFIEAMQNLGADLAKVINYEIPPAVYPSLVLAYDRYEDLDREENLINRNIPTIKHPGFLPQGSTIEVLLNG
ncbi:MAG: hypothetical protein ACC651_07085, partial [Candidatus Scalindua sp.]